MRVAAAQFDPEADVSANLDTIGRFIKQAATDGAELIVFSEEAMLAADKAGEDFTAAVASGWPMFTAELQKLSAELDISIIAGGYEKSSSDLPYNTLVAVDNGEICGSYRKMHLYDAFSYQESRRVLRGEDGPVVVSLRGLNVGLVNCYDLRFPEFVRALVEAGADLLSVSAAWVRGSLKEDHWTTLLRARAIENTCWVVASSMISDDCIGLSMAIDPMGVVRTALGEEREGLLTVEVSQERADWVRAVLPVLKNRRILITKE